MDKFKDLFKGKKKYVTIGAILLVVLLALFVNRNKQSGGNPRLVGTTADSSKIATGAGNPGLTGADIQNAIDNYDRKNQEKYDAMNKANMDAMEKMSGSFADSLNKIISSNNDQFESITKHLTQVENQNKEWAAGLQNSFNDRLNSMMMQYRNNSYGPMNYNSQPNYAGGYGGSSDGLYYDDRYYQPPSYIGTDSRYGYDYYNSGGTTYTQPTYDRLESAIDHSSSQGQQFQDYLDRQKSQGSSPGGVIQGTTTWSSWGNK